MTPEVQRNNTLAERVSKDEAPVALFNIFVASVIAAQLSTWQGKADRNQLCFLPITTGQSFSLHLFFIRYHNECVLATDSLH